MDTAGTSEGKMTPKQFMGKWGLSSPQFGSLMGLSSAQVDRLIAKSESRRATPTQAQSDRLLELDLLLTLRSLNQSRRQSIADVNRLAAAVDVLIKLLGMLTPDLTSKITEDMELEARVIEESDAITRLDNIFLNQND